MRDKRFLMTQLMKLSFQLLLYALIFASFFFVLAINNPQIINPSRTAAITMASFAVLMVILSFVYGGYDIGNKKSRSVFASILITTFLADLITYLQLQIMNTNPANQEANAQLTLWGEDFALLVLVMIFQVGLIYFFVSIGHHFYAKINPPKQSCIITSSQELAAHVARKISSFRQSFALSDVVHYECPDVKETIKKHDVVFLAGIPDTEEGRLQNFCYRQNKTIYLLAELEDVIISTAKQSILDDTPFLYIHRVEPTLIQRAVKRLIDIVVSVLGLALLSPVMLAAALCILFSDMGPVFFRQKRATLHGRVFQIIKFRTMYVGCDDTVPRPVSMREDDPRVTPVGRMLRKYRIDEIPQLFNVLRGDMSMVGPRPEMLENVEKYEQEVPEFKYRQQMKAGLTGLAQIDGKYNTTPKDKAILDLMYIENFSLATDLKLIMRTLTIFFRRDSTEGFASFVAKPACPKMRTAEPSPAAIPQPAPGEASLSAAPMSLADAQPYPRRSPKAGARKAQTARKARGKKGVVLAKSRPRSADAASETVTLEASTSDQAAASSHEKPVRAAL